MIHLLLCGGSGSRLWPLSREQQPKQFIHLLDDQSLFQKCYLGNKDLFSKSIIVCNYDHYPIARKQLKAYGNRDIRYILEPVGRNTAAALALTLQSVCPDAIVLATPADHQIEYSEPYFQKIKEAVEMAREGHLVLFGITPHAPETCYGYIEAEGRSVTKFCEKPSSEKAFEYLTTGRFYWNSGMICFKAGTLLEAMKIHSSEILELANLAYRRASVQDNVIKIALTDMESIPSISIDHALLEKASDLKMVLSGFRWTDLGNFESLFQELAKDDASNSLGVKSFYGINAKNNLVMSKERIVAAIDVEDLVIIDTKDALLISKFGSTSKVREIVHQLKQSQSEAYKVQKDEERPWGEITVLEQSGAYKVKRILVHPGMRLSLQKHQHRNEHWVIVAGTGRLTLGTQEKLLHPNQSVYIPCGEIHRIDNIGSDDLIFIEVQYGDYLGEDDLIRIEADFERETTNTLLHSTL